MTFRTVNSSISSMQKWQLFYWHKIWCKITSNLNCKSCEKFYWGIWSKQARFPWKGVYFCFCHHSLTFLIFHLFHTTLQCSVLHRNVQAVGSNVDSVDFTSFRLSDDYNDRTLMSNFPTSKPSLCKSAVAEPLISSLIATPSDCKF